MVLPNEATKTVIEKFSDLKKSEHWKNCYLYYTEEGEHENSPESEKLCGLMTALGRYVEDILNMPSISKAQTNELKEIFLLIEFFLNKGEQLLLVFWKI